MPPWASKMEPVSLMFKILLNLDSRISPTWAAIAKTKAKIKTCENSKSCQIELKIIAISPNKTYLGSFAGL